VASFRIVGTATTVSTLEATCRMCRRTRKDRPVVGEDQEENADRPVSARLSEVRFEKRGFHPPKQGTMVHASIRQV